MWDRYGPGSNYEAENWEPDTQTSTCLCANTAQGAHTRNGNRVGTSAPGGHEAAASPRCVSHPADLGRWQLQ